MPQAAASPDGKPVPAPSRARAIFSVVGASLLVAVLSAGAGVGYARFAGVKAVPAAATRTPPEPPRAPVVVMHDLPPIVANLAEPAEQWVRLEASFELTAAIGKEADLIARRIGDDLLAFIRSARADEINTPEGFGLFRKELDERAALASGGRVRGLYVHTLVIQ